MNLPAAKARLQSPVLAIAWAAFDRLPRHPAPRTGGRSLCAGRFPEPSYFLEVRVRVDTLREDGWDVVCVSTGGRTRLWLSSGGRTRCHRWSDTRPHRSRRRHGAGCARRATATKGPGPQL
jgi:hypothetical protein